MVAVPRQLANSNAPNGKTPKWIIYQLFIFDFLLEERISGVKVMANFPVLVLGSQSDRSTHIERKCALPCHYTSADC